MTLCKLDWLVPSRYLNLERACEELNVLMQFFNGCQLQLSVFDQSLWQHKTSESFSVQNVTYVEQGSHREIDEEMRMLGGLLTGSR
jgi:hypothetical protein